MDAHAHARDRHVETAGDLAIRFAFHLAGEDQLSVERGEGRQRLPEQVRIEMPLLLGLFWSSVRSSARAIRPKSRGPNSECPRCGNAPAESRPARRPPAASAAIPTSIKADF